MRRSIFPGPAPWPLRRPPDSFRGERPPAPPPVPRPGAGTPCPSPGYPRPANSGPGAASEARPAGRGRRFLRLPVGAAAVGGRAGRLGPALGGGPRCSRAGGLAGGAPQLRPRPGGAARSRAAAPSRLALRRLAGRQPGSRS